jgi:hypothetical protein
MSFVKTALQNWNFRLKPAIQALLISSKERYRWVKIALTAIFVLFFAFFYIKGGEPNVFEAKLITKNGEKDIKYPFKNLELEKGERYVITFFLPSDKVYKFKIYEPVEHVEVHPAGHTGKLRNISETADKTQEYVLDNIENTIINSKEVNSRIIVCQLKHNGENIPLTVQIVDYKGIHSYGFGLLLAIVILLVILTLKLWEKDFGKNSVWLIRIIFLWLICHCFYEFYHLLFYEFSGALHSYDGAVFFSTGRAIANGLKYYTEVKEIKPPGFYFLMAIVIKLFGSPNPMHILQALVLLGIAALPVLAHFKFSKEKNEWILFTSILMGMLLALYSGGRAGEVMIESYGACIGAIAVFFMASPEFEQRKRIYIPIIAIAMLGSCGMKEPFFFAILASSILFANNFKIWCLKFLLPFIIACILGAIILLATGIFDGYIGYLTYMSSTHTNVNNGSPLGRMLQVWRLLFDLNDYSQGLAFLLIISALATSLEHKFHLLWKLPLGILLTTLSVGAGSEWFDHHYVFAVPFYSAICFLWIKCPQKKNIAANILACAVFATIVLSVFNLPKNDWEQRLDNNLEFQKPAKLEALYLDEIMDRTKIERYAVIAPHGSHNFHSFGYTKHSPWQPGWHPSSWHLMEMQVLDEQIDEINKSQIVSFQNIGWPSPYREKAIKILEEEFTTTPWKEVADIPQPREMRSVILFRKR